MPFNSNLQDFIGTGITYPIELNSRGTAVVYTGWDLIKSSIRILLTWYIGQRFFLGEYGSRCEDLLEEPSKQILKDVLAVFIKDAITAHEKRVTVLDVIVTPTDLGHKWEVEIGLSLANGGGEDTMTWPFYSKITY